MDLQELVQGLQAGAIRTPDELQRAKIALSRRHGWRGLPSNAQILQALPPEARDTLVPLLRVKGVRTASGIVAVGAMTMPMACPHGKCTFCPGGPEWGTPQSYLGTEPATLRALQLGFDPYRQVEDRVRQLEAMGHATDKVELIVLGGTFTSHPREYQEAFVKGCFDGLNGVAAGTLVEAHGINEATRHRCVGLTVETKPDWFLGPEVEDCLRLGVTRIELGLQSTFDDVLEATHRGHTAAQGREATARARDVGLKVGHHMMTGLPRSSVVRDLEALQSLVRDPAYRPDLLKIYPTLVMEGTALWGQWLQGTYRETPLEEVVAILADFKRSVPPWMRLHRVQREFRAQDIRAGVRRGDLRVLVGQAMADRGWRCRCLRCREVGLVKVQGVPEAEEVRRDYIASGGREVFLSFEDISQDLVLGYLRLRLTPAGEAFLRELRVHGEVAPLGHHGGRGWQHRGMGRRLLQRCVEIAWWEWGVEVVAITSAVGVREYYWNFAKRTNLKVALGARGHVLLHR